MHELNALVETTRLLRHEALRDILERTITVTGVATSQPAQELI